MQYAVGHVGRVLVARFEDHDDILAGLTDIARRENIRAAVIHLVGGVRQGGVVVGPQDDAQMPPEPIWRQVTESHECVGTGTIFWDNGEPKVHLHMALGKKDTVTVGCLRKDSATFVVLEAILLEIVGTPARRELDPATGLALLRVDAVS
ncbi:MAG: DNA-binding protein with PD1-like protein DNA-binding motif-like protein [Desulfomicrobiaceae bacterium]|jgi:predicted DNA-binding protein with PD1-like motif|nr:DNA-binding protein [Desulfomicrobiaceae bacterium]MBZ4647756.1 DNA-binding protein with PD1-like protein DNA-binding motif-like protein [Desulfomicrobiaceae bacterium]MBZ4685451.1 DNA-binding protein with PD1-like protein DNA-binding motif-like protein [Desulfomicrobiaceae bacterium]MDI3492866.1 hypothetical protein [Desulfomicrobiaceae bacterium]MDK2872550.1 hypothetical protein [Desulfomicrobiaceae bacterium]